jgi:transposase-like protein
LHKEVLRSTILITATQHRQNLLMIQTHSTPDCTGGFVKNGKYKGVQRYICPLCRKTFSDSPKRRGRPSKGDVAMSGKLRVKLCRVKKVLNERQKP